MAKNDQEDAYEKLLSATLARTIDFVKFAEAKNAALLTFSSAWIIASVNILFNATAPAEWKYVAGFVIVVFGVSALTALSSFIPKLLPEKYYRDPEQKKSLLYFGHISDFSSQAYKIRAQERYFPPEEHTVTQNYIDDLAVQIHVNSCIATAKFNRFKHGAYIALIGIALLLMPPVMKGLAFAGAWISAIGSKASP